MTYLLKVNHLSTEYSTPQGSVSAIQDVTFQLEKGHFLGIAGESGCGKSTMAYSILGLLPRNARVTAGQIMFNGTDLLSVSEEEFQRIRWKDIAVVFQQSMNAFNPVVTFTEQMVESILAHENVTREEAIERARSLFTHVGLDSSRLKNYPFEFSGGMKQRAMIAMALVCKPKLILADEPTTALDVTVQAQVLDLLSNLRVEFGLSAIIITHDISVIAESCDRIIIMYAGKIVEESDVKTIFSQPLHPYTKALVSAIPSIDVEKGTKKLVYIPGAPPNLNRPPSGCRFHPRCPYARDRCKSEEPLARNVGSSLVACHFAEEMMQISTADLWGTKIAK